MLGDHEPNARSGEPNRVPARAAPAAEGMLVRRPGYPSFEWEEEADKGFQLDLRHYFRILLRHWLIIVAALILAIAGGVAKTLLTTPMYTATGTLQIDREAARVTGLDTFEAKESVSNNADEFFQTQFALLKSRSLAEATAKDSNLNLARDQQLLKALGVAPEEGPPLTTAQAQNAIASYIMEYLSVEPVQRSRVVSISISSPDPVASARLVNAVIENFINETLKRRINASSFGVSFLERELASEKAGLEQSERDLAEYARQQQLINITPSTGTGGGAQGARGGSPAGAWQGNQTLAASSLAATETALNEARNARFAAQQKLEVGRAAVSENSSEVLSNLVIQTLKQERARKQAEYDSNLATFQPGYESMRSLKSQIDELDRRIRAETDSIKSSLTTNLQSQYQIAVGQEQKLAQEVSRLTRQVLDTRERSIKYDILQREVDTRRQLYDSLLQQYKEIGVAGNLRTNNISPVDRALPPGAPSEPRPVRNLMISIVLGLVIGVGLALLMEFLDESIRTPEDVERKLGLSLLGSIPKLDKTTTPAEALQDVRSPFSEAYYSVRTALQFSTNEGVPSSLAITSSRPSEGKSTSASAIAKNFARLGSRVLLIDADLRNPSLHRVMKTDNTEGFSNCLTGGKSLRALTRPTDTTNLFFMPCGPLPPNPAELLAGNRLREMLEEAKEIFDMVIFDCPPVMGLADAPMLTSAAAGTILVIEAGSTGRHLAKGSIRRLTVGNTRLLGVLLTKFDARSSSYGYGYGYAYAYDYNYGQGQQAISKK